MTDERRALLEKAYDESIGEKPEGVEAVGTSPTKPEDPDPAPLVADKESKDNPYKKEAQAAAKDDTDDGKAAKPPVAQDKKGEVETLNKEANPVLGSDKPPVSWRAGERDLWHKVSPEVKAVIQRREKEIQTALQTSAGARKFQDEFIGVVRPFAHLISAQSSTPLQAVKNLMTTAAGLTTGNAEQKARIVCEIINNYGVDIKTLDSVLAGVVGQKQNGAGQASLPEPYAQALRPIYSFMEEVRNARERSQQQTEVEAHQTIEQFAADKPYFDDLRDDIADLMEVAANRGQKLTLQQAYDRAVAFNPEVSKILNQRKQASDVSQAAATLARARRAATSIQGSPGNVGAIKKPSNRREALEQAWDNASR